MRTSSPIGLLLDVDAPVASTETRTVPEGIIDVLVRLARRGVPVGFNTGRSTDFLLHNLIAPLRDAGLPDDAPFHAICEKGAVWFPFSAVPSGDLPDVTVDGTAPDWLRTDPDMAIDADTRDAIWALNDERAGDLQFTDHTKLAMVSLEKTVGADQTEYERVRDDVAARVEDLLAERGLAEEVRVAPSVISVDVEHRSSGKDLGVERCFDLLAEAGTPVPGRWLTAHGRAPRRRRPREALRRGDGGDPRRTRHRRRRRRPRAGGRVPAALGGARPAALTRPDAPSADGRPSPGLDLDP